MSCLYCLQLLLTTGETVQFNTLSALSLALMEVCFGTWIIWHMSWGIILALFILMISLMAMM